VEKLKQTLVPPRRYAFRVDASTDMGTGHVMRCVALAERLQCKAGEIHFIARAMPEAYQEHILRRGYSIHLLPSATRPADNSGSPAHADWLGADWREDAQQTTVAIAAFGGADVLVIDHYAIDIRWEAVLHHQVPLIFVIDDLADRPHDCDVLLDQDYYPDPAVRYRNLLPSGCRTLFGPGHALLRREFLECRASLRKRDGSIRRVLVFYGGTDLDNLTSLTLDALEPRLDGGLEVDVVVGALNPYIEALRHRCEGKPHLHLHVQVTNMAELVAAADLAFGACGAFTWERCILGLPAIVVVLAEYQREPVHALVDAGAVVCLGDVSGVTKLNLGAAFDRLAADPALCRTMTTSALSIMHRSEESIEDVLSGKLPE
jgi:UDP-2,4-diacetamido-2,4,6-trideoxy-beta-L-altropyranose hydrolase